VFIFKAVADPFLLHLCHLLEFTRGGHNRLHSALSFSYFHFFWNIFLLSLWCVLYVVSCFDQNLYQPVRIGL
jgi:hypothetical protein